MMLQKNRRETGGQVQHGSTSVQTRAGVGFIFNSAFQTRVLSCSSGKPIVLDVYDFTV